MYRAIFEAAPYGTAVVRPLPNGRHLIEAGNAALAAMFGCDPDALVSREIEDLLVDEAHEVAPDADGWCENSCWNAHGRVIWTRWRSAPLAEGDDDRLLVFVDDIDERVRARHRAQRQARVLDLIPEPVIVRALDGTIVYWNSGAAEIYGHRAVDVIGHRTHDLLDTRFVDITLPELERQLATRGAWQGQLTHRHADGRLLHMESKHVRDDNEDGPAVILEINVDVTDRLAAERALAASESKFRLQFANSSVGQVIHRLDGTVVEANAAMATLLRRPVDEFQGMDANLMFHESSDAVRREGLALLLGGDTEAIVREITLRRSDGSIIEAEISASVTRAPDGKIENIVGLYQDITARKAAERSLTHQASHDSLTGLANRALLIEQLTLALDDARSTTRMIGVLYLDLDGFKTVNDTLGHHVGDALLNEVGRRLGRCVRHDDVVSRIGGDEFVVLCPELDSRARLRTIALRILTALSAPYALHGHVIDEITASIGVSYPTSEVDAIQALREADLAMYQVKHSGKNRIGVSSTSMPQLSRPRVDNPA